MKDGGDEHEHLSRIETHWPMVFRAHPPGSGKGTPGDDAAASARRELMDRYGGAARRYLLGSLRDPEAADELAQDFAVKFLGGAFANVDPGKGRFRDFLKKSLYHLMMDHHRRRSAAPKGLVEDVPADGPEAPWAEAHDEAFRTSWRQELMARAWEALERLEKDTRRPVHTVLRLRIEDPALSSAELAARLSPLLGKAVDENWVRVNVHRAREHFVRMLLEEVRQSLGERDRSDVALEEELAELGLLEHCRPALKRGRTNR